MFARTQNQEIGSSSRQRLEGEIKKVMITGWLILDSIKDRLFTIFFWLLLLYLSISPKRVLITHFYITIRNNLTFIP